MFCSKCGNEIMDEAVICPKCGCKTGNLAENKDDSVSGGLMAVSILVPIIGVILGIIYLCQKKTKAGTAYLVAGVISWIVWQQLLSIG